MNLKDYFRSYSMDELVQGAECYYSDELENFSAKKQSKAQLKSEIQSGVLFPCQNAGEVLLFSAHCKNHTLNRSDAEAVHPKLYFYKKLGRIGGVSCECDTFQKDFYFCPHVAALLTKAMLVEHGEDIFRGTELETRLQRLTNTQNPFELGVLRHTDNRLLSLLNQATSTALPKWQEKASLSNLKHPLFQLECILNLDSREKLLELRFGTERLYVVSDISTLLDAYQSQQLYHFGKNNATLLHQHFTPFARAILDFLSALASREVYQEHPSALYPHSNRHLSLQESDFHQLMQLCDGQELVIQELNKAVAVDLNRKGLRSTLRKQPYGATLSLQKVQVFYESDTTLYLMDSNGIFLVAPPARQSLVLLSGLLSCCATPLYIRHSDLNRIFREVLPLLRDYGELRVIGIKNTSVEIEPPEFQFELDYGNGTLSCVPYVLYPHQGLKCKLFDSSDSTHQRDGQAEQNAAKLLNDCFQTLDFQTGTLSIPLAEEEELFHFMRDSLPLFERLGTVLVTDALRKNRVRSLPAVSVGISVHGGNLLMSLKGEELTKKELDGILSAYRKRKKYYRLKSGEFFSLEPTKEPENACENDETWNTLSDLYEHYGNKNPENMLVPLHRALYLQEMLEKREDILFNTDKDYQALLSAMTDSDQHRYPIPQTLTSTLRPYQADGCRWIQMLKNCGFGGILADDMGLGKTLQVLSFLSAEKEHGKSADELRTLIICPASLVYNWQREIQRFTPELSSVVIAGTASARKKLLTESNSSDIWITSYDLLKRDIAHYETLTFANEIIDEAQFIKNQTTQVAQSVRLISSQFRMALTGTPIENHLSELWSILDYLMPDFFGSYSSFQREYEAPIVTSGNTSQLRRLRSLVHPFILRRLKNDVLTELPPKLEEVISVQMEGEQRRLYNAAVQEMRQTLDSTSAEDFKHKQLQILSQLTRLRQLCCDPSLVFENYHGGSAKLDTCIQLIHQAIDSGHKLLLFSQFTSMLDIICRRLEKEQIPYHRIDGSVGKEQRMTMVDSFADDDVPVFCISLKAGGTGLNLTAADIVIHYDPWWNQAAQNQATDRAHRIGQTQRVNVYELITQNTIEDEIQLIKESKNRLVSDVLSGDAIGSTQFDKNALLALLGD